MRQHGRLTTWNDDKGFGFITPEGGGEKVFLHISSLSSRRRRPRGSELLSYTLELDPKGRAQAKSVAFVDGKSTSFGLGYRQVTPLLFAAGFLTFLLSVVIAGRLPTVILGLYLAASVVAFVAYAFDKSAAAKNQWRIRESTLHLFALVGGWPGALTAQRLLRHKSAKTSFQTVFWITVLLNCGALGWLSSPSGSRVLHSLLNAV